MQEFDQFFAKMEYQKSLNQNYLVYKNERGGEDYELRMLTENQIEYLLPLELRSIDGRDDMYYQIGSLQPLSKLYKNREMKLEDVRIILIGLTGAIAAIQEYMLDESHIVLLPEYIFIRRESREVRLLFHPFYEEDIRDGIRGFADYLIGRIDHTEQQAVMMGYQFYRIVREDNFIIEDIIKLYQKEQPGTIDNDNGLAQENNFEINEYALKDRSEDTSYDISKNMSKNVWQNRYVKTNKTSIKNMDISEDGYIEKDNFKISGKEAEEINANTETNLKKLLICSILALASGCFLCFGIGHYQPDQMSKVILALIMLISVLGIIKEVMHHIRNQKKQSSEKNNYDKIFSNSAKNISQDKDDTKNINQDKEVTKYLSQEANNEEMGFYEKKLDDSYEQKEESEIYGRTVLLSSDGKIAENILLEKRRGKEIVHQLDDFPYIIGKVNDSVNLVLNDVSVSRIHAKLTEENGQIYVQDCNSTNGTYVNGVLLEKEEKIPIEADDEIRIGRITLLYQ